MLHASKLEMKKSHSLWRFALLSDLGAKQLTTAEYHKDQVSKTGATPQALPWQIPS